MRTWGIRQTVRWFVCYALMEPSVDLYWQDPSTVVVHVKQKKRPADPSSPNSFVFNDVVGFDLFFLNTYEKHTLQAMNTCVGALDYSVLFPFETSRESL